MAAIDSEINTCILNHTKWHSLSDRLKDIIGSSQEYDKRILKYSIENQLRYRGNLVSYVISKDKEKTYYKHLLDYSRDHLMLFPYHLSDFIAFEMRITPFQYYLSVMKHIIDQEKSYDTLPNFTAADCLRLLGIGRNQYIEIMNQPRSPYMKYFGLNSSRAKDTLPDKPNENVNIEPWWFINAGYIMEEDVRKMVLHEEKLIIDKLTTSEGIYNQIPAMTVDERFVRSLYLKGLIYLDVPIYDDDMIVVPPLEGFVMNRVTGDYFETLLYKIFVSIDQNTPVSELAAILDIDIKLVKNAISMYCRLGFAYKRNLYIDLNKFHPSWKTKLDEYQRLGINVIYQTYENHHQNSNKDVSDFMYQLASIENIPDVNSPSDECPLSPSDLCASLNKICKSTSSFLGNTSTQNSSTHLAGSIQTTSHPRKIVFLYDSNLAAFLMMGNMSSQLKNHAVTMFEVGKLPDESIDSLLYELSKINDKSLGDDGFETKRYFNHAIMLYKTIEFLRTNDKLASDLKQSMITDTVGDEISDLKVGLDLIRVESLSNLDPKSCQRLLQKNYRFGICLAPLSQDVGLEAIVGLPNLGPGSPLLNSLWLRLYIYQATGFGPDSLLLVRGSRLDYLPCIFVKYKYLLITAWNREPICVSTISALLTINETASHFPVLIQGYPIEFDAANFIAKEKVYLPLPLIKNENQVQKKNNLEDIPSVLKLKEVLDLYHVCGYITLLKSNRLLESDEEVKKGELKNENEPFKSIENNEADAIQTAQEDYQLFDCTFGVPLFDEFLNEEILQRISSQSLCTKESLEKLTSFTNDLNMKIENFLGKLVDSSHDQDLFKRGSDDQLHFFRFPNAEQYKLALPLPGSNLLFANGKLEILSI